LVIPFHQYSRTTLGPILLPIQWVLVSVFLTSIIWI